ncbi:pogo transposable element with KRAB domain [Rhizophagus clarus]|uniref:Pogo transposable element with KRAB domain n=1 Tax=Rhizophagus clarus TaxID=94130 RepID=A0A8H3KSH6_9GLOM|nr:pogo transposable element with KRAB domain [Rhizophagus clarus]
MDAGRNFYFGKIQNNLLFNRVLVFRNMVRGNFHKRRANITTKKRRQCIEPKQLREWISNKDQLLKAAPYIQKLTTGARPKYPQLEVELMEWFRESRRQLKVVTRYMIQAKARSLSKKQVYQEIYPDIKNAKLSQKWVDGFMSRHNLVNRRKTTISQKLPENYVSLQSEFLSYVLFRRREHQYPLSLIANMDETPISFNLPNNTTVEQRGTRTISILSTGYERSNFTVVLACTADGTKLPPVIIFKLVNVPREEFPDGVIIRANRDGWMNESEMICTGTTVKNRFREKHTDIAVIPGGLTSRLQPLDVSLNKSFKSKVRRLYNNWMKDAIKDYTPSGKIKRPTYSLVANWIKESWDSMDTNMIKRSFKCCGVSNSLDGSEDNLIFDFNKVKEINNRRKGIEEENEIDSESESSDNESESEDESNESEDSEGEDSEGEDNYYKENEDQNVIQNWN